MPKFYYLAGSYSRRDVLAARGRALTEKYPQAVLRCSWLFQPHGEGEKAIEESESMPEEAEPYAVRNLMDIEDSDFFIAFTFPSNLGPGRGGRHWEAGWAAKSGKKIIVIGPVENIFYRLPKNLAQIVGHYESWEEFLEMWTHKICDHCGELLVCDSDRRHDVS